MNLEDITVVILTCNEAPNIGRTLRALDIKPVTMDSIVPSYLWRFRKTGQFGSNRLA